MNVCAGVRWDASETLRAILGGSVGSVLYEETGRRARLTYGEKRTGRPANLEFGRLGEKRGRRAGGEPRMAGPGMGHRR